MNLITNGNPLILEPLGGEDTLRVMLGVDFFWYREELNLSTGMTTLTCMFTYKEKQITLKRCLSGIPPGYYKIIIGSLTTRYVATSRLKIEFEHLLGCHLL